MVDKVSSEDGGGRAQWRRCGTTGIHTAAEEMQDGNIRDVEQRIWQNGLDGRQHTGKISTGIDYQPGGVSSLQ